jgi:hypothetical protein
MPFFYVAIQFLEFFVFVDRNLVVYDQFLGAVGYIKY